MKYRLSGLMRVEVVTDVEARSLDEAKRKAERLKWTIGRTDLYSVTDIVERPPLDRTGLKTGPTEDEIALGPRDEDVL